MTLAKLEHPEKNIKPHSVSRLWLNTFVFSVFVFIGGSLYLFARRGNYDLYIANKVLATTGLVLIGLSLALSGLCCFWDFVDDKIVYRKYLGLVGFFYAVIHVLVSLFFLPERFPASSWLGERSTSFAFGLAALVILIGLAAISNKYSARKLGGKRWRSFLRVGYVAFIFTTLHFFFVKYKGWLKWFDTHEPFLPPLSLLEFIFAVLVVGLRIALWFHERKKHQLESSPIN